MDITSYLLGKNASGGGGGGSDLDWTAIGYEKRPQAIDDGYNYAKQIKDNWTPETSLQSKFEDDLNLIFMPLVDTSNTTTMQNTFKNCKSLMSIPLLNTGQLNSLYGTFNGCSSLEEIPLINTSNVTTMRQTFTACGSLKNVPILDTSSINVSSGFNGTFNGCPNLTDTSLDNILQMCINATSYTGTKTLQFLGFNSTYNPDTAKIMALPHYQDFINAGWTIGY